MFILRIWLGPKIKEEPGRVMEEACALKTGVCTEVGGSGVGVKAGCALEAMASSLEGWCKEAGLGRVGGEWCAGRTHLVEVELLELCDGRAQRGRVKVPVDIWKTTPRRICVLEFDVREALGTTHQREQIRRCQKSLNLGHLGGKKKPRTGEVGNTPWTL